MAWKSRSIMHLCLLFNVGLALAAGSFGGLVVPNMGQVKNGEGVLYYMDAPWGRLYATEQGLLLNVIQDVEQAPPPAMSSSIPQPWAAVAHDMESSAGPASPFATDPFLTSPFAKGGMRGISEVKRECDSSDPAPPDEISPNPSLARRGMSDHGPRGKFAHPEPRTVRQTGILLTLPGACWREVIPEDPQITKLNFFYGNDPKGWVTDVPTYGRLRIRGIFPGTDLVLEPKSKEFWRMEGFQSWRMEELDAQVREKSAAFGISFSEKKYSQNELEQGMSNGQDVPPGSKTDGQREAQTLIWGTFLGGHSHDWVQALAVDGNGDVIARGGTWSYDFPVPGGYDQNYNGETDIFVAKLSGDGSILLWGTFLGGWLSDELWAMALDTDMNIVIVGDTYSDNFPTTPDSFDTVFNSTAGWTDIYAAKLAASGDALLWGTYIGGENDDVAYGCALESNGDVILAGNTNSRDIPVPGGFDSEWENANNDYPDIYISKLTGGGKALSWASYLGGSRSETAFSMAMDCYGDLILAGKTSSQDIPVSGGYDNTLSSFSDIYLASISINKNEINWGTFLGGNDSEHAYAVGVDAACDIIVLAMTYSSDMPAPGGYDDTYNGNVDLYIAKISPDGRHLLWGTYLGGKEDDGPWFGFNSLALDRDGNIYASAWSESADLPVPNGFNAVSQGEEFYLAKLSSSGNFLHFGSYLGGSGMDEARCVLLDSANNILLGGKTNSTNFPVQDAYDTTFNGPGYFDGVIAKLTNPTNAPPPLHIPAAARTPGAHGTSWRTDATLLNTTDAEACFDLIYLPGDSSDGSETFCERRCLAGGRAFTYRDILGSACGVGEAGAGSLRIEPQGELTLTTRTYNEGGGGGTYGQSVPAMPAHEALIVGDIGHIIGLKQTDDYRTNLGFSEIAGRETDVEIRIYDALNSLLLSTIYHLPSTGWLQVGLADLGVSSLDVGRAEVELISGGAVLSYASVVDNRTGDATYIGGKEYPTIIHSILGGDKAVVLAARAQGAYETNWRTELILYNPDVNAYDITLTYRSAGVEYSIKRFIPSGCMGSFEDVIAQLFPQVQGNTSGILEVWPSTDLFVASRTYNLTDSGTYGQGVPAEKVNNIWSVGNLFPMMQTVEYRTNIGLVEVSGRPMDVQITVFDGAGSQINASSISLMPFEWRQIGLSGLGITFLDGGWAEISAISAGGLHFYASMVDNRTGDAVFIPASK